MLMFKGKSIKEANKVLRSMITEGCLSEENSDEKENAKDLLCDIFNVNEIFLSEMASIEGELVDDIYLYKVFFDDIVFLVVSDIDEINNNILEYVFQENKDFFNVFEVTLSEISYDEIEEDEYVLLGDIYYLHDGNFSSEKIEIDNYLEKIISFLKDVNFVFYNGFKEPQIIDEDTLLVDNYLGDLTHSFYCSLISLFLDNYTLDDLINYQDLETSYRIYINPTKEQLMRFNKSVMLNEESYLKNFDFNWKK